MIEPVLDKRIQTIIYDLKVGDRRAAIDTILVESREEIQKKIDHENWWFERVHESTGSSLRLFFEVEAVDVCDRTTAEHLRFLDRITLHSSSTTNGQSPSYFPQRLDEFEDRRIHFAGAFASDPNSFTKRLDWGEGQPLVNSCLNQLGNFSIDMIAAEWQNNRFARKDAAPLLLETLFVRFGEGSHLKLLLREALSQWIKRCRLPRATVRQIDELAKQAVDDQHIMTARKRLLAEDGDQVDAFYGLVDKIYQQTQSPEIRLTINRYMRFVQLITNSLMNQLGFQSVDVVYLGFILRHQVMLNVKS